MEQTSILQNDKRQTVRLPKACSMPDDVKKVNIISLGRSRLITPVGESWDSWFNEVGVSDDFMQNREQPAD